MTGRAPDRRLRLRRHADPARHPLPLPRPGARAATVDPGRGRGGLRRPLSGPHATVDRRCPPPRPHQGAAAAPALRRPSTPSWWPRRVTATPPPCPAGCGLRWRRSSWHRRPGPRAGHRVGVAARLPGAVRRADQGFDHVIAVELEADPEGRLTGRLTGPNVRGPEKAVRLRRWLGGEDAGASCGPTATPAATPSCWPWPTHRRAWYGRRATAARRDARPVDGSDRQPSLGLHPDAAVDADVSAFM